MITDNKYSLPKSQLLNIAGVSRSGYHSWLKRSETRHLEEEKRTEEDDRIKELMRKIIRKLGYIPGKRIFELQLKNDYNEIIDIKKCKRLMSEMNIVANRPKKDAYKGQATYFHEASSMHNHLNQNFLLEPRKIVLTDITYLYYGIDRSLCYLCTFFDPFTNEVLGYSVSRNMNLDLVKEAYDNMMNAHGSELRKAKPYLHSDQGSVYLASEFRHLLVDDGFIQSMSRRGNSQDNAPMESWFGKLKTRMIDTFARCKDYDTLTEMVNGYIHSYNTEQYQLCLAGLSPKDYYTYISAGIYPMDKYYSVTSDRLLTPAELVNYRREIADTKNKRVRRKTGETKHLKNPLTVIERDSYKIACEILKYENMKEKITEKIDNFKSILIKIGDALQYVKSLDKDRLTELYDLSTWRSHKELHYVFDIPAIY